MAENDFKTGIACKGERQRIRAMLKQVEDAILGTKSLDHNAHSESPATHVILDVLQIVANGLSTGISVTMFKHLYPLIPENKE